MDLKLRASFCRRFARQLLDHASAGRLFGRPLWRQNRARTRGVDLVFLHHRYTLGRVLWDARSADSTHWYGLVRQSLSLQSKVWLRGGFRCMEKPALP